MPDKAELRMAAERAAAEVLEVVHEAALEACRAAVREALAELVGIEPETVDLEDRMTRTEAARRLDVAPQTIIRLEEKGLVHAEREDGRVYVRLSEVRDALKK